MRLLIILLVFITIIFALSIIYFNGYNKLSIIKAKMDSANDIISKTLKDKQKLMNELYSQIKKVIKKKDYLKDFNSLNNKFLNPFTQDMKIYSDSTVSDFFRSITENQRQSWQSSKAYKCLQN